MVGTAGRRTGFDCAGTLLGRAAAGPVRRADQGRVAAEGVPGGFGTLYKVLTAFEDAGRCQRGYFVESLGGAQFAVASTVDRLRSYQDNVDPERPAYRAVVLAAADPANPYGSALPWPTRREASAHRPGRKAGALVVLVDGELAWFLERGGRSLLTFPSDADAHRAAAGVLADWSPAEGSHRSWSSGSTALRCSKPAHPATGGSGWFRRRIRAHAARLTAAKADARGRHRLAHRRQTSRRVGRKDADPL